MARKIRTNVVRLAANTTVTSTENTANMDIGGAVGYSVLIKLTDNGSAAGSVSIRAGVTEDDLIIVSASTVTQNYTANVQSIIIEVSNPNYRYFDVIVTMSAGDLDYTVDVTVMEDN